ncbi:DUF5812 family protein [Halosegnis sp.]|uniref:DUF5812 family protein n=1 Tax=Halosegnis sp. TaxID=2864959 RepID=UPI0035D52922
MTETDGTFLVTHADAESAVLRDVDSGQVHTLGADDDLDLAAGDVLEATLTPSPPLEVQMEVTRVRARRRVTVEESEEPPTTQERTIAAEQSVGELTRRERAGDGELHVLTVPSEETTAAVEDVLDDEETLARAARMPTVSRVEVRSDAEAGVVSVRYLP